MPYSPSAFPAKTHLTNRFNPFHFHIAFGSQTRTCFIATNDFSCQSTILAVSVFPAPLSPEMMKPWFRRSRTSPCYDIKRVPLLKLPICPTYRDTSKFLDLLFAAVMPMPCRRCLQWHTDAEEELQCVCHDIWHTGIVHTASELASLNVKATQLYYDS